MNRQPPEIPATLRRQGIRSVTDNIPEGYELELPPNALLHAFGEEIMKMLLEKTRQREAEATNNAR